MNHNVGPVVIVPLVCLVTPKWAMKELSDSNSINNGSNDPLKCKFVRGCCVLKSTTKIHAVKHSD